MQFGLSDPHNGRRTVVHISAKFNVCGKAQIVADFLYKPKNMRLEETYNNTIRMSNQISSLGPLKAVKILAKEGYGYAEFIEHKPTQNLEELADFYYNAGRLLSILYLLGCTDCHFENLIAHGNQLVLVDTETLLEPLLFEESATISSEFDDSVLRLGMLPHWIFIGDDRLAIDISALGIEPPETNMVNKRGWLKINTDLMIQGRTEQSVELPKCLPIGVGQKNRLLENTEYMCKGYERQCYELIDNRGIWLYMLGAFAGKDRRIVLRPTRIYGALAFEMLSPKNLSCQLNMSLVLEKLAITYLSAGENKTQAWPIFRAEVNMMLELDIPFFTHLVDGDTVNDANGGDTGVRIYQNGLDLAVKRLEALDKDIIHFQSTLVRGTIGARATRASNTDMNRAQYYELKSVSPILSTEHIAKEDIPFIIANKLCDLSIRRKTGNIDWLGINLHDDGDHFSFGSVGMSLYGGTIGIACFLHQCKIELAAKKSKITDSAATEVNYEIVISQILEPLCRFIQESTSKELRKWWGDQSLGLSGSGGIILGLQLLDRSDLAAQLIKGLTVERLREDSQYDVISGCAGLAGALLSLPRSPQVDKLIFESGNVLNNFAKRYSKSEAANTGLLGFAHGAGGIAAALANIAVYTHVEAFNISSKLLIGYERSKYDQSRRNWPDLRGKSQNFMTSWCSGSAGVALSRYALMETEVWDEECGREICIGLLSTASNLSWQRDHLCCGSLGSASIMQILLKHFENMQNINSVHRAIDELFGKAFSMVTPHDFSLRCFGTGSGSILLPGMFTGLSGMGLALIRTPSSLNMLAKIFSAGILK